MTVSLPAASFPQAPLRGIVVPLATPLRAPDELDSPGLVRLVDHVISGGVAGLFVLGTCGEGPCLSYRTRYQLIEEAARQADHRVPLLVGITDTSFAEAIELARWAEDNGAAAVVAAPPYYLPLDPGERQTWFQRLADESPLPVVLYNIPSCTHSDLTREIVAALVDHPNVAGVKDSSGSLETFAGFLPFHEPRPDWTIMIGPEHLTAEAIARGADGGVNGGANIHPQLFTDLAAAAFAREADRQRELMAHVQTLQTIYQCGEGATAVIRGLKAALGLLGLCSAATSEPIRPVTDEEHAAIRQTLARLELLPSPSPAPAG